MTLVEQLAGWAAEISPRDLPSSVAERAGIQVESMHAAAEAGAEAAAPLAAAAPDGPLGDVYRGAGASIAHDWDDYLYMGHTGHSSVWVSEAFAPSPERARVAQVAANEVAGRLGAALLLGPHNGQFWSVLHSASGAVAAGVGLGLDAERLAHALALALYQPPYGLYPGFMGPSGKLLTAAEPAVQGARAAMLAAAGLDGALDIIESPRGLLAHLAFVPRPRMLGALGEVWLTDTLAFKPFPGCAYLQTAVDAALSADVEPGEVASIEARAGYLTLAMERLGSAAPLTPVGVNFSVARSVAVALLAGRLTHRELDPRWLDEHRDEIEELASRVRVRHDWPATLACARGAVDAGASLRDVPPAAWPRVLRRARELGMTELGIGWRDLRELASRPAERRELRRLLAAGSARGVEGLDVARLRLTFPTLLVIRRHDGTMVEVQGREVGACGHPIAEQREVVAARDATVRERAAATS